MTDQRENTGGRRASDRPVYGILAAVRDLLHLVAIVALVLAIVGLVKINHSRRASARDSCQLLRGLVLTAVKSAPAQHAAAMNYINRTPLRNCTLYASEIVR